MGSVAYVDFAEGHDDQGGWLADEQLKLQARLLNIEVDSGGYWFNFENLQLWIQIW